MEISREIPRRLFYIWTSFSITKLGKIEFLKIRTNRGLSVLQPMNTTSLFVSNHFMNLVLRYFMFDSGDSIEDVHQSLRDIFCTLCAKCQAIFFVISKALKAAKSLPIGRSPTEMPPRPTVIFKKQKRVGGNNKSSFEGGPLESLLRSFESKKRLSKASSLKKSKHIRFISGNKREIQNYFVYVKNYLGVQSR